MPAQSDRKWKMCAAVGHQRHIRGLKGNVGARRSHDAANRGVCHCRRVGHAVTDHCDLCLCPQFTDRFQHGARRRYGKRARGLRPRGLPLQSTGFRRRPESFKKSIA
jgi:hypothetical protein